MEYKIKIEENQALWKQVEKTDEDYMKDVNVGRRFKSIDPHYQLLQATKIFGAYGSCFGVEDERFTEIKIGQKLIGDIQVDLMICRYNAILRYTIPKGEKTSIHGNYPIGSSIQVSYISNKGKHVIDDDYVKKLQTDAFTKGLSKLGFNADVFMGKFDGNKYETIEDIGVKGIEATDSQIKELLKLRESANEEQQQWIDNKMLKGLSQRQADTAITKLKGMLDGNRNN